ncbi:glutathione-disulfide reductase [Mesorhizobium sp. B292B1B]|uniref:glutathione-disulfide reductase n=1 Tax=unclassified Mesorhizobium TaxID=325217 RepID=UPI00112D0F8A|nr:MULTISPECIES: glutathione-disulfide reductase [unclassified Mesorhizobium]MCA0013413.1 glutathione-disulfide reductase [Mesorhizobium sp. B294B1A1]MCA0039830.1 glutathione-disulfide reductase [Mesorhizobium sp. B292B1B]TPM50388.1 glutathione-disulfide reductase [Mesorhizobium sp. B2-3-2]
MAGYDYDLFVIGGGSGGVRAARVAAALGKRVGIAEEYRFGGTCVIRGCVPKKLYVYASQFPEHFADAAGYGWTVPEASFDWPTLVANKDREISRLEAIYERNVEGAGGEAFHTRAMIVDPHVVHLLDGDRTVTADQILIATGGRPAPHPALPGHEYCIFSNEAFDLEQLPKSIMIEGGGYIAVEFANIFHGLGVDTTLVYRGKEILSRFDMDLRRMLHETMEKKGIKILCHAVSEWIRKRPDGRLDALLTGGQTLTVDQVMLAIGRIPNTENMGLEGIGIEMTATGAIQVDAYSRTNVENIWAIGDVTNRVQLTPVAIHEAMCFVETAFKGNPTAPDHDTIATAVFSQPEIGTVGLSEDEAIKRFSDIEIYRATFRPMRHTLSGRDEKMLMKLVVDGASKKVLGAHILGPDAGEMAQLLAIPLKAGLVKDDFDRTMAVHPTAAEELVTMYKPTYRVKDGERIG